MHIAPERKKSVVSGKFSFNERTHNHQSLLTTFINLATNTTHTAQKGIATLLMV